MAKIVECPHCGWARNIVRTHPRTVAEIFPEFEGNEKLTSKVEDPSDRAGAFYCPDCNEDFIANGVTWRENVGWFTEKELEEERKR